MKQRPEYDLKIIGENLKRLRKRKKLSVKEVQEYLQLGSVQAIYKYENGRGYPQTDVMFALMELYEASLYDIIYKQEDGGEQGGEHFLQGYRLPDSDELIEPERYKDFFELQVDRLKRTVGLFDSVRFGGKCVICYV